METPRVSLVNGAILAAFTVAVTWSWNILTDTWAGTSSLRVRTDERKEARDRELSELKEGARREINEVKERLNRLENIQLSHPVGCPCAGN